MASQNHDRITSLGSEDISDLTGANETPRKAFVSDNLGYRTLILQMPIKEFYSCSEVANDPSLGEVTQRKLDSKHAEKLAIYILKGLLNAAIRKRERSGRIIPESFLKMQELLGSQPYMSIAPIIVNIRNCNPDGNGLRTIKMQHNDETAAFKVMLDSSHVFWVIDGQHRRKALQNVFEFLEYACHNYDYPKKGNLLNSAVGKKIEYNDRHAEVWIACLEAARQECNITVIVHLGLDENQERQLFYDLNNLGKTIEKSLALKFDNSNPINLFIKNEIIDNMNLQVIEKDVVGGNWGEDTGAITRKDIVAINAILFLNKTNISGATNLIVNDRIEVAKQFWETIQAIPEFGEEQSRIKTIAAQPVVLKAIAKLVYSFAFGKEKDEGNLRILLDGITDIDFSHKNKLWNYYNLPIEEKNLFNNAGLSNYLPNEEDGNRDIGSIQNNLMRFGSKHNDIYPIIGDMIRWKLNLPSRKK